MFNVQYILGQLELDNTGFISSVSPGTATTSGIKQRRLIHKKD